MFALPTGYRSSAASRVNAWMPSLTFFRFQTWAVRLLLIVSSVGMSMVNCCLTSLPPRAASSCALGAGCPWGLCTCGCPQKWSGKRRGRAGLVRSAHKSQEMVLSRLSPCRHCVHEMRVESLPVPDSAFGFLADQVEAYSEAVLGHGWSFRGARTAPDL